MGSGREKTGVLIEYKNGHIKAANFGMLSAACDENRELMALVLDPLTPRCRSELQQYGVDTIIDLSEGVKTWNPVFWSQAVVTAMEHFGIKTLVGLTSPKGRDLLPRIAALLDAPLVMDCLTIDVSRHIVQTTQYSGKTIATLKVTGDIRIYGVRPNAIPAAICRKDPQIIPFTVAHDRHSSVEVIEVIPGPSDTPDLTEADVIISGGRGVAGGENFGLLFECAAVIGAGVGASRVAVDQGWVPYTMQVGQTGSTVNPKVYLAVGLSGSVQHFAGMKTSGMIIAVNTDPKAPIMSKCDYYAIADLFEVLPELTRQLAETVS